MARFLEISSVLAAAVLIYCASRFVTTTGELHTVYKIGLVASGICIPAIGAFYFTVVKRS